MALTLVFEGDDFAGEGGGCGNFEKYGRRRGSERGLSAKGECMGRMPGDDGCSLAPNRSRRGDPRRLGGIGEMLTEVWRILPQPRRGNKGGVEGVIDARLLTSSRLVEDDERARPGLEVANTMEGGSESGEGVIAGRTAIERRIGLGGGTEDGEAGEAYKNAWLGS